MKVLFETAETTLPARRYGPVELPAILGRGSEAVVKLDDPWVSRRHCAIDQIEGRLILRDIGARHGTFVNGERITEVPLNTGDRIGIGLTTLRVCRAGFMARLSNVLKDVRRVWARREGSAERHAPQAACWGVDGSDPSAGRAGEGESSCR